MKPAALGASIAALTVLTGSLLAPQAASALDFTFSFDGVSGLIENLVVGQNTCDGLTACVVTVEIAPAQVSQVSVGTYEGGSGAGFFVSPAGVLEAADWIGRGDRNVAGKPVPFNLRLTSSGESSLALNNPLTGDTFLIQSFDVTFAAVQPPASSVPGPLPLFGAAAAFGFSRKLRNRIKRSTPIA